MHGGGGEPAWTDCWLGCAPAIVTCTRYHPTLILRHYAPPPPGSIVDSTKLTPLFDRMSEEQRLTIRRAYWQKVRKLIDEGDKVARSFFGANKEYFCKGGDWC